MNTSTELSVTGTSRIMSEPADLAAAFEQLVAGESASTNFVSQNQLCILYHLRRLKQTTERFRDFIVAEISANSRVQRGSIQADLKQRHFTSLTQRTLTDVLGQAAAQQLLSQLPQRKCDYLRLSIS